MTLNVTNNLNKIQTFKGSAPAGLSSLNAAYLNRMGGQNSAVQSAPAQYAPQAQIPAVQNTMQHNVSSPQTLPAPVMQPNGAISNPMPAYMPGVGAVPSGYFMPGDNNHGSEDRIIKKTPLTGARIMADKIAKDIFVYAPKGMQGSKNSNFYEYLSLGIVPYITGSAMMIATSVAAKKFFNPNDAKASGMMGKGVAMGVILYAAMKWAASKVINKGTELITGVDMDMPYKKVINELPENGREKVVTEFHKVFESVDFPRWDLINKEGEENGNRYEFYDKIAKDKLGCDGPLNAPDQVVQPLIKQALTKAMAARSIASFLWAGVGVAIAAQKPFAEEFLNFGRNAGVLNTLKHLPKNFAEVFVKSAKQLWKGSSAKSAIVGKGLVLAAAATTVLGLLNVKRGYKVDKKQSETKIDYKKDYVEN